MIQILDVSVQGAKRRFIVRNRGFFGTVVWDDNLGVILWDADLAEYVFLPERGSLLCDDLEEIVWKLKALRAL